MRELQEYIQWIDTVVESISNVKNNKTKKHRHSKNIVDEKADAQLTEGDPPNWYQGSSSAIPGTPNSLKPQPTAQDLVNYRREQKSLAKFLGRK